MKAAIFLFLFVSSEIRKTPAQVVYLMERRIQQGLEADPILPNRATRLTLPSLSQRHAKNLEKPASGDLFVHFLKFGGKLFSQNYSQHPVEGQMRNNSKKVFVYV